MDVKEKNARRKKRVEDKGVVDKLMDMYRDPELRRKVLNVGEKLRKVLTT